jgi:hypothetical protein
MGDATIAIAGKVQNDALNAITQLNIGLIFLCSGLFLIVPGATDL